MVSHPFGDLVSQHLHRKHGLSQSKLAAGIMQPPTVITAMCQGQRLTGPRARERVLAVIGWLHEQGALDTLIEANAILNAAGMATLNGSNSVEAGMIQTLHLPPQLNIRTVAYRPTYKHNLPTQLTSFVGREEELAEIRQLVVTNRLITIIGTGGIGKTRLALEAVSSMAGIFLDGIWLVELAPITDPISLPQLITQTLNLIDQPTRPPLDVLCDYFELKHSLLVMDNCEHIIDAAAGAIEKLLQRCPKLHMLATSRETLRLLSETTYRVPSLQLPDGRFASLNHAHRVESVRLFVARAQAQQPKFRLTETNLVSVAHICRCLDGIPLALELVAALMHSLSVEQIAAHLDGHPDAHFDSHLAISSGGLRMPTPRHQTMRSALDWSYNLLSTDEQRTLARLSVFVGGCILDAATAVTKAGLPVLDQLIRKSLVLAEPCAGEMRYRLLEPIRQYAAEKLDALGETNTTRRQHALTYFELAKTAEPHLHAHQQKRWLDRLEYEHDNFRVALDWSHGEPEYSDLGLQLAINLWPFWWMRGHLREGRRWVNEWLGQTMPISEPSLRAQALLAAAELGTQYFGYHGYFADVPLMLEQAIALFRAEGNDAGLAFALCILGDVVSSPANPHTDFQRGNALLQESLMLARRQSAYAWIAVRALFACANSAYWQIDLAYSSALFAECLALAKQVGDLHMVAVILNEWGDVAGAQLNFDRSVKLSEEALQKNREIGNPAGEEQALLQLGVEFHMLGEFEKALEYLDELQRVSLEHESNHMVAITLHMLGLIARDQGDYALAVTYFKESFAWYHDKVKTVTNDYSVVLVGLGTVASLRCQYRHAAILFGAAEGALQTRWLQLPHNQIRYGRYMNETRVALGNAAYEAAFAEGKAMTLDQLWM